MPPGLGMLATLPQDILQWAAKAPEPEGGFKRGVMSLLRDQDFIMKLLKSGAFGSLLGGLGGKSERRAPMSAGIGNAPAPRFSLLDSMGR